MTVFQTTPQPRGALLRVEDLRTYIASQAGLVRAVDGVSFEVHQGETLGLVGESGCGKSVLARALLGINPAHATINLSGSVFFQGKDLRREPERRLRAMRGRDIAMIFQDPMTSLSPTLPVGRQIERVIRYHTGAPRGEARDRAVALLDSLGIPSPRERALAYPHQLSGGMRQRVVIALALACNPKLLIADEPTTALDVTVQAQILDLLRREQEQRGMALILITHNLGIVAGLADRVAVMYAGRVVEIGPTRSLLSSPRMPYTAALLRSVPRLSDPKHTRLSAIAGRPPVLVDPPDGCRFAPRCDRADARCRAVEPAFVQSERGDGHGWACWTPIDRVAADIVAEQAVYE